MSTATTQPEPLQLAEWLDFWSQPTAKKAAAALRRLYAENQQLRADLEAVGAGGVGPLIPTTVQHQIKLSRNNDLQRESGHSSTSSSTAPQPLTDEQIVSMANPTQYLPEAPEGWVRFGFSRKHLVGFARAVLDAAQQPPAVEQPQIDWHDMYLKERRRAEMWIAKYEQDIGKLEVAVPVAAQPQVEQEPAYLLRDLAADIGVNAMDLISAIRDAGLGDYSINMRLPARVCVAMCKRFADVGRRPVARVAGTGHLGGHFDWCVPGNQGVPRGTLLYTRPQPQREPLTVEQIDGIIRDLDPSWLDTPTGFEEEFCRAIERAHEIGGEA